VNGSVPVDALEPEEEEEDIDGPSHADEESKPPGEISSSMNGLSVEESHEPTSLAEDDRFEALVRERDNLRNEVTELRKSLEEIQAKHVEDLEEAEARYNAKEKQREKADEQYRTLLGKVNHIKAQLGERLKADAVCSRDPISGQD
jgi:chromosome segregation ATPase